MTDLLDIAPQNVTVDIFGRSIEVQGLTLRDIAALLRRFPELRALFGGGEEAMDRVGAALPDLVAAVIAGGMGHLGDEGHEQAAARLPADAQSQLFGAILKLTMPQGIGPFVEGLATAFGVGAPATALANGSLLPPKN